MTIDLAHQDFGGGAPLLILHGLFGSGSNWRSTALRLGEIRRVIVVDQRNHGDSPHTPSMDYPAMARDLCRLMDRLNLASADLLGHSMGGKTAMQTALLYPDRVRSLVVADIAPVAYQRDYSDIFTAMAGVDPSRIRNRGDAETQIARHISDPNLRLFLLKNLGRDGQAYRWKLHVEGIEASMPALLDFPDPVPCRRFDGPTLFVAGELSDYVLESHHEAIRERFPQADITAIPGAGHWLHVERPRHFLSALQQFLGPDPGADFSVGT
jgi:esterase